METSRTPPSAGALGYPKDVNANTAHQEGTTPTSGGGALDPGVFRCAARLEWTRYLGAVEAGQSRADPRFVVTACKGVLLRSSVSLDASSHPRYAMSTHLSCRC